MTCPRLETVAAWSLGDLSEAENDAFEAHWFSCERCAARSEKMLALTRFLGQLTAFFLTGDRRKRLEAAGPLVAVEVPSGGTGRLSFGDRDIALWILRADLAGVERVDCEFVYEGTPFASFPDVPFDAERGELTLVCRTHYEAVAPARFNVRLTARTEAGQKPLGEYVLDHVYHPV